eukprot:754408-Hanusia_phi.AAC.7
MLSLFESKFRTSAPQMIVPSPGGPGRALRLPFDNHERLRLIRPGSRVPNGSLRGSRLQQRASGFHRHPSSLFSTSISLSRVAASQSPRITCP